MKNLIAKLRAAFIILILVSCHKETPPVASFTYVVNGYEVTFTSTSTNNPTSLAWDFGDGTNGSGTPVIHTYTQGGSYTAKLTATNKDGTNSSSQIVVVEQKEKVVEIKTSFGSMFMWLYNQTPKHKTNFITLTESKFFDGTAFHRIVPNFVIQGGDPNSKDSDPTNDGYGGPGYTIDAEILSQFKHDYGAVGAARDNNPQKKSNGSQFYIVVNQAGAHNLDGNYTVFGMIMKGMDVAEKIVTQPRNASDRPLTDIKMDCKILNKTKEEIKTEYGYTIP